MNLLHLSNCFIQDHKISKKTLHERSGIGKTKPDITYIKKSLAFPHPPCYIYIAMS
ncbi:hypothetical protein C2W63_01309 [Bacillus velezensis]|nr:hypothetical protein C2W63_01309 [Bacillus velezensis]